MGSYCSNTEKWYTVTKASIGLDEKSLKRLQTEIDMVAVKKEALPNWLCIHKSIIPDFIGIIIYYFFRFN